MKRRTNALNCEVSHSRNADCPKQHAHPCFQRHLSSDSIPRALPCRGLRQMATDDSGDRPQARDKYRPQRHNDKSWTTPERSGAKHKNRKYQYSKQEDYSIWSSGSWWARLISKEKQKHLCWKAELFPVMLDWMRYETKNQSKKVKKKVFPTVLWDQLPSTKADPHRFETCLSSQQ